MVNGLNIACPHASLHYLTNFHLVVSSKFGIYYYCLGLPR